MAPQSQPDARVEQRVEHVDDEVEDEHEDGDDDDRAHHQRVVAVERALDEVAADAGEAKIVSTTTEPVSSAAAAGPR